MVTASQKHATRASLKNVLVPFVYKKAAENIIKNKISPYSHISIPIIVSKPSIFSDSFYTVNFPPTFEKFIKKAYIKHSGSIFTPSDIDVCAFIAPEEDNKSFFPPTIIKIPLCDIAETKLIKTAGFLCIRLQSYKFMEKFGTDKIYVFITKKPELSSIFLKRGLKKIAKIIKEAQKPALTKPPADASPPEARPVVQGAGIEPTFQTIEQLASWATTIIFILQALGLIQIDLGFARGPAYANALAMEIFKLTPLLDMRDDAEKLANIFANGAGLFGIQLDRKAWARGMESFLKGGGWLAYPLLTPIFIDALGPTNLTISATAAHIVANIFALNDPRATPEAAARRAFIATQRVTAEIKDFYDKHPYLQSIHPYYVASDIFELASIYPQLWSVPPEKLDDPDYISSLVRKNIKDFIPLVYMARLNGISTAALKKFIIENKLTDAPPHVVAKALGEALGYYRLPKIAPFAAQSNVFNALVHIKQAVKANPAALSHPVVFMVYNKILANEEAIKKGMFPGNLFTMAELSMAGMVLGFHPAQLLAPVTQKEIVENMELLTAVAKHTFLDVAYASGIPPHVTAMLLYQMQQPHIQALLNKPGNEREALMMAAISAGIPPPVANHYVGAIYHTAMRHKLPPEQLLYSVAAQQRTPFDPEAQIVRAMLGTPQKPLLGRLGELLARKEPVSWEDIIKVIMGRTTSVQTEQIRDMFRRLERGEINLNDILGERDGFGFGLGRGGFSDFARTISDIWKDVLGQQVSPEILPW
jgi:hypothetical protein